MHVTVKVAGVAALVMFLAPFALCEQFQLKWQDAKDSPYLECVREAPLRVVSVEAGAYSPAATPAGIARGAFFARVRFPGGESFMLLLDPAKVPVLYVDANHNNDFTDDTKYDGAVLGSGKSALSMYGNAALFGPVELRLGSSQDAPGVKALYEVYNKDLIIAYPAGANAGEVAFGAGKFKVAVVDVNFNGRFDDVYPGNSGCDMFAIDANKDRKYNSEGEVVPLTGMIPLGGEYYNIGVAADGTALTVEKVKPKLGTLKAESPGAKLNLISQNGFYTLGGPAGKWDLPVGKYEVAGFSLAASDSNGKWIIDGIRTAGKSLTQEVKEGETSTLDIGAPLTPKLDVAGSRGTVSIGIVGLVGRGGETYSAAVNRNGARPAAPKLQILDEAGKVLAKGAFAYG